MGILHRSQDGNWAFRQAGHAQAIEQRMDDICVHMDATPYGEKN